MTSFVSIVLAAWSDLALPLAERGFTSQTHQSDALGKAVVELDAPGIAAMIEIWEHANCLDTTVHHTSSSDGSLLAAGTCASNLVAIDRLRVLQSTLLNEVAGQSVV